MSSKIQKFLFVSLAVLIISSLGVSNVASQPSAPSDATDVLIDGSSTVAPISQAVAEEFENERPDVEVLVAVSGTSGGFRRFCPEGGAAAETDISDASRPIRGSEVARCSDLSVEFIELPVAFDGLTVAVSNNTQAWPAGAPVCLTRGELAALYRSDSAITNWSDLRSDMADSPVTISGAATTSGTHDTFLEFLDIEDAGQRTDGLFTEDDNLLAQQAGADPFGITYFGFSFFLNNQGSVKAVAIDPREEILSDSNDCDGELPGFESIEDGSYPFSRILFVYVNAQSAEREAVSAYVDFYLSDDLAGSSEFIADVGYVSLNSSTLARVRACWDARATGTTFGGDSPALGNINDKLDAKGC